MRHRKVKNLEERIEAGRRFLVEDAKANRGKWRQPFGNDGRLYLELGCGKGDYTVDLAERNPSFNYIGVDIKGARLWKGAKYAEEHGVPIMEKNGIKFLKEWQTKIFCIGKYSVYEYEYISDFIEQNILEPKRNEAVCCESTSCVIPAKKKATKRKK